MSRLTAKQSEIAREFNIAPCTVTKWKKMGMPIRDDGLFDLDEIRAWQRESIKYYKRPRPNKKEANQVWGLAKHAGMSTGEIAKNTGLSQTKVSNILRYMETNKKEIDTFRDAKADIFAAEQLAYLSHITEDKLEGTSAKDLVQMAKLAYEKERIELGESTENVAVVVKHIRELKERRKELDDQPGSEAS